MMPPISTDTKALWNEIRRLDQQMRALRGEILQAKEVPMREIYASYTTDAAQSIDNNAYEAINFEDKVIDTHNAVTTGAAWKFTAPATTMYFVWCFILFNSTTAWALTETGAIDVYKNGVTANVLDYIQGMDSSAGALYKCVKGSTPIYLKTNEYIDIRIFQNTGGALTLYQDSRYNWVKIVGLQGI